MLYDITFAPTNLFLIDSPIRYLLLFPLIAYLFFTKKIIFVAFNRARLGYSNLFIIELIFISKNSAHLICNFPKAIQLISDYFNSFILNYFLLYQEVNPLNNLIK